MNFTFVLSVLDWSKDKGAMQKRSARIEQVGNPDEGLTGRKQREQSLERFFALLNSLCSRH